MRLIGILVLLFLLTGQGIAQDKDKNEDKKEQSQPDKKKDAKKSEKGQSFGEMAESAGKKLWSGFKRQLGRFTDDISDKKDKFVGKNKVKPKEDQTKEKDPAKEKDPKKKKPAKKSDTGSN